MFRIHDPAVDPDAPGGPLPPVGALISTNREQLWVGSLQEDINVRLVLEEWDGAPPPCGDAWDEEAKGSVYLRGQLSISMGQAGTAVHGLRLGGGFGDYSVRVYASNRDVVTRRYTALFDRHRNPLSDEFQQEKRTLEGLERYLVQLWRESLAETDYGLVSGSSATSVGLTLACCALPVAAAVAERVWALWLVVDLVLTLVLTLAEGCCVPSGSLLVTAEIAVLAGALDACGGACRCMCARNGTIA
ncbi:MAG TPA: hypothetical protein VKG61_17035 [Streptosporangiaceae bacterium]|nr:hypothetical protein [Streptosporangiaceae bacterium]